jgi:diguanylate cyclase (GGDEF)-like protein
MPLDPLTAYLITTAFTLLNGAVLGFMHPALPKDLQPSAADWRTATLLFAGSGILFVAHGASKQDWLLPFANGCLLIGMALYHRSLRRYVGRVDRLLVFVPAMVGLVLLTYFTLIRPSLAPRIVIASVFGIGYVVAGIYVLSIYRRIHHSISSAVLIGLMVAAVLLFLARGTYFTLIDTSITAITQTGNLVNAFTPILIAMMPIVGTTAFGLLCFERIRRDLHVAATTDALTGLPNRRMITDRANEMFEHAKLKLSAFSMGVIDVDHFKQINDRYGHEIGDRVLTHIAQALARVTREGSVVGRQGGEEFVVLFDAVDRDEALKAVERLRAEIASKPFVQDGNNIDVTVSIGLATRQDDDANVEDVLRRADRALYRAKDEGRNCVR